MNENEKEINTEQKEKNALSGKMIAIICYRSHCDNYIRSCPTAING